MKTLAIALAALCALSCQKGLFPDIPRYNREHTGNVSGGKENSGRDTTGTIKEPDSLSVVYVAAIRFPEGASWRDGEVEGAQ